MRLTLTCSEGDEFVDAEEFFIDGTTEWFAVHCTHLQDGSGWDWAATHIETGFRVSVGMSSEECIAAARQRWAEASPEKITAAIKMASNTRAMLDKKRNPWA